MTSQLANFKDLQCQKNPPSPCHGTLNCGKHVKALPMQHVPFGTTRSTHCCLPLS